VKRSSVYESIASLLALLGAVLFGFGLCPVLNPIQFRMNLGPAFLPAMIFCLPASLMLMWIAFRLSRQAQRLKESEASNPEQVNETDSR
jgi:hypothetical protein